MDAESKTEGKTESKINPQAKALMHYGRDLATLLWQKAIASSTPETRQALFTWKRLLGIAESMLPEKDVAPRYHNVEHEDVLRQVQAAEYLLTGATPDIFAQRSTD